METSHARSSLLPSTLFLPTALLALSLAACGGDGGQHTVVIDSRDVEGATDYTLRVSGSIEQATDTVAGIPVSGGDRVRDSVATGRVGGGADGFRVTGRILAIELDDASATRVLVDGERRFTEEHTLVIVPGEGGGTDYTVDVTGGTLEAVDGELAGRRVTTDPADRVEGASATGTVDSTADGYRVKGAVPALDLADPTAATVYLDGREHHTVVVDSRGVEGGTDYTIEVEGRIEQVESEVDGISVSGGDRVEGGTATGRVGGGADGFRTSGAIRSIELGDASGARVLVDGEPHYTEDHTVVIQGTDTGETSYTVRVIGALEAAEDTLAGRAVGAEPDDRVEEGTATGSVAGDADGYRVRGGIVSVEVADPSAATVYLDGREYHTVVIDSRGVEGGTDYTIEVAGRIEQAEGELAGVSVSGGDRVEGGTATGRVGGGADGFRVFGTLTSIELSDPGGAVVLVDGVQR